MIANINILTYYRGFQHCKSCSLLHLFKQSPSRNSHIQMVSGDYDFLTVQWSFGVTCWEVFTGGKQPYPGIRPLQVSELLESGQRMSIPANSACSKEM